MNTGQTLLTICAMILLGTTIVGVNRTFFSHGVILQQTEIGLHAISLAQGMIEEASGKAFDNFTAPDTGGQTNMLTSPSQLTAPSALGPEAGESYRGSNDFNDFDDFNFFRTNPWVIHIPGVDTLKIFCAVDYVDDNDLETPVAKTTWHKRLTVSVAGVSTQDTVKVSTVFSYWWFR